MTREVPEIISTYRKMKYNRVGIKPTQTILVSTRSIPFIYVEMFKKANLATEYINSS